MTWGVHLYLRHSRLGRAIGAVRMDRETATLMGVRVERIYAVTFGLGLALAEAGAAFRHQASRREEGELLVALGLGYFSHVAVGQPVATGTSSRTLMPRACSSRCVRSRGTP